MQNVVNFERFEVHQHLASFFQQPELQTINYQSVSDLIIPGIEVVRMITFKDLGIFPDENKIIIGRKVGNENLNTHIQTILLVRTNKLV